MLRAWSIEVDLHRNFRDDLRRDNPKTAVGQIWVKVVATSYIETQDYMRVN